MDVFPWISWHSFSNIMAWRLSRFTCFPLRNFPEKMWLMLSINLDSFYFSVWDIYSIRNVVAKRRKYNQLGPAELFRLCHNISLIELQSLEGWQYGNKEPPSVFLVLKAIWIKRGYRGPAERIIPKCRIHINMMWKADLKTKEIRETSGLKAKLNNQTKVIVGTEQYPPHCITI